MASMENRVQTLGREVVNLQTDHREAFGKLEQDKENFMMAINDELAKQNVTIGHVITEAQVQFAEIKAGLQDLFNRTQMAVTNLEAKVTALSEEVKRGGGVGGADRLSGRGYIPQKHMVPEVFTDKIHEWRQWQEDVEDYMDTINPGMKALLQAINREDDVVDEEWRRNKSSQFSDKL